MTSYCSENILHELLLLSKSIPYEYHKIQSMNDITEDKCVELLQYINNNKLNNTINNQSSTSQLLNQSNTTINKKYNDKNERNWLNKLKSLENELIDIINNCDNINILKQQMRNMLDSLKINKSLYNNLMNKCNDINNINNITNEHIEKLIRTLKYEANNRIKAINNYQSIKSINKELYQYIQQLKLTIESYDKRITTINLSNVILNKQINIMNENYLDLKIKYNTTKQLFKQQIDKQNETINQLNDQITFYVTNNLNNNLTTNQSNNQTNNITNNLTNHLTTYEDSQSQSLSSQSKQLSDKFVINNNIKSINTRGKIKYSILSNITNYSSNKDGNMITIMNSPVNSNPFSFESNSFRTLDKQMSIPIRPSTTSSISSSNNNPSNDKQLNYILNKIQRKNKKLDSYWTEDKLKSLVK